MKRGVPPTARKARTGELTPPGMARAARWSRAADAGTSVVGWGVTVGELMGPVSQPSARTRSATPPRPHTVEWPLRPIRNGHRETRTSVEWPLRPIRNGHRETRTLVEWPLRPTETGLSTSTGLDRPDRRGSATARAVGVEVVAHDRHGVTDGLELLGRHDVDEVLAHALDVQRRDLAYCREPAGGEHELDPPLVVRTLLPGHPATVLEPLRGVRQSAARLHDHRGQLRHAQPVVGALGEHRDDLVLRQLEPGCV